MKKLALLSIMGTFAIMANQYYGATHVAESALSAIRQEVNILNSYITTGGTNYATSSEIIAITDTSYSNPIYYFEAVASTTASGSDGAVQLVDASTGALVANISIPSGSNTAYTRFRSASFLPSASSTVQYRLRVKNGMFATAVGAIAGRVIILQSGSITSTQTQIEIGSATTTASNTTTLPLKDPKYWYYDSTKWDGDLTFSAEVTYKLSDVLVASSTIYSTPGTFTYNVTPGTAYTVVEAWGGGGGGGAAATTGGGGGGGGAYARSTTTPTASSYSLTVGTGGAQSEANGTNSTYNTNEVVAAGGTASTGVGSGAGGTTANSTGQVEFAGGNGGLGLTTNDTGGGGGGSAGPAGNGVNGTDAPSTTGGGGGAGNNGQGGAGGPGGNGTCGAAGDGQNGTDNATGGGGGGGGDTGTSCLPGHGGNPGGGGGGFDNNSNNAAGGGGDGQIKLTEWRGAVSIALEEDDGNFGSWTFKKMIVMNGTATSSPTRVRSSAFTPTAGRNYRLVASTTAGTSYSIYNAKIVVEQAENSTSAEDSYSESNQSATFAVGGANVQSIGQSFSPDGGVLNTAIFYIKKTGTPTNNMTARLYSHTGTFGVSGAPGTLLATSDAIAASTLTTSLQLITFTFTGINKVSLVSGTKYFIVLNFTDGGANTVDAGYDSSSPSHSGNGWDNFNGPVASFDYIFYVTTDISAAPTLLEPQYLLANKTLSSGTSLQDYDTLFDPAEWAGTTNTYYHEATSQSGGTSDVKLQNTSGPTDITGSTITDIIQRERSSSLTMPGASATLDVVATTNNNDIYSSRIIVQVDGSVVEPSPEAKPQDIFFFE